MQLAWSKGASGLMEIPSQPSEPLVAAVETAEQTALETSALPESSVGSSGFISPSDFLLSPGPAAESTSSAWPDGPAALAISAVAKSPCLDSRAEDKTMKGELMICCGMLRNCG